MSDSASQIIEVLNETGIHARPATFLVGIVRKLSSTVTLKKGEDTARAKSLIEILGLSLAKGDSVEIITEGEQAEADLQVLVKAFKDGLGENVTGLTSSVSQDKQVHSSGSSGRSVAAEIDKNLQQRIINGEHGVSISGVSTYPGLVVGEAFLIKEETFEVVESSTKSTQEEAARLELALKEVEVALQAQVQKAEHEGKTSQAEIFSAHLEVLGDEFMHKTMNKAIAQGKTAEFAVKTGAKATSDVLWQTENILLQERMADVKDIERHLLTILSGRPLTSVSIPVGSIVIAEDLTPSNITALTGCAAGVILAKGSATSHISIMMKNEGIPSIVAVGEEILSVKPGTSVVLKSSEALVELNPQEGELASIKTKIEALAKVREDNLLHAKEPALTQDGVRIRILGNVGGLDQIVKAYELGAEGVGLVRSEFLFMNSPSCPTEEQQHQMYQSICDAMHGEQVVVRTLDVGGDKPISYINIPYEENPIVGLRGIRNYAFNQEIIDSQISALLKVTPAGVCKIMAPMVSSVDEVKAFKEQIESIKSKLGITTKVLVGIMVEVPSVALMARQFAGLVDFFSIGTNDLAQYVLAMDRGHSVLTKKLSNLNPALLQAIAMTCEGAKEHNVPVGVCGAMASELECIPLLIGLGVDNLSCSSELIPSAKALVRELTLTKCQTVAKLALKLSTEQEVKALVKKEFGHLL